jgi:ribosomal protein S18 acetylase RimI-like enzyme
LEKTARQRVANRYVWIMVSDFNLPARAFYRRQGYEEVAPIPDVVKDGMGEVLIRKRLR